MILSVLTTDQHFENSQINYVPDERRCTLGQWCRGNVVFFMYLG